jgi:hypothetical protein
MRWTTAGRFAVLLFAAVAAIALVCSGSREPLLSLAQETKQDEAKPEDPAKKKASEKDAKKEEASTPRVYTNDDLGRLPPESPLPASTAAKKTAPPAEAGVEKAPDPVQVMENEEARKDARQLQIAEAQRAVAAAEARVRDLERRALAVKNPFLARPEIPDEDRAAWDKMTAPERLKLTEDQLKAARDDLERAKARLDQLQSGS